MDRAFQFAGTNIRLDSGQVTFSFGQSHIGANGIYSGHLEGVRIQLYWPTIRVKVELGRKITKSYDTRFKREYRLQMHTSMGFIEHDNFWAGFIRILGFGAAIDWQGPIARDSDFMNA